MSAITFDQDEYSKQIEKLEVRDKPNNFVNVQDLGARVRVAQVDFTAGANISEDTWVRLARLPRNAKVFDLRLVSDGNSSNASVEYHLVPRNDKDTASSVELVSSTSNSSGSDVGLDDPWEQIEEDEAYVAAKFTHATTGTSLAAGKTVKGYVFYIL